MNLANRIYKGEVHFDNALPIFGNYISDEAVGIDIELQETKSFALLINL
jgi:hypothetical protein